MYISIYGQHIGENHVVCYLDNGTEILELTYVLVTTNKNIVVIMSKR